MRMGLNSFDSRLSLHIGVQSLTQQSRLNTIGVPTCAYGSQRAKPAYVVRQRRTTGSLQTALASLIESKESFPESFTSVTDSKSATGDSRLRLPSDGTDSRSETSHSATSRPVVADLESVTDSKRILKRIHNQHNIIFHYKIETI